MTRRSLGKGRVRPILRQLAGPEADTWTTKRRFPQEMGFLAEEKGTAEHLGKPKM